MSNLAYQTQHQQNEKSNPKVKKKLKTKTSYGVTPGEKIIVFVLSVVFLLGCAAIISNQAAIYKINTNMQGLQQQIDQQSKTNSGMKETIAELKNPDRILKIAQERGLSINENNIELIQN